MGTGPPARPILQAGFVELDPDLITLQEIIRADDDQAADILGEDYKLVHQSARELTDKASPPRSVGWSARDIEVDLHVTDRTHEFACTSLVTEIQAPEPVGRFWLINNLPDWQLDHEHERQLQASTTARALELIAGCRTTGSRRRRR